MKILTVVGARPQFVKAATVSAEIARRSKAGVNLQEVLVHTGQHYDQNMSQVFFDQLEVPRPKYNLAVGSGSHGAMTGKMLAAVEQILLDEKPEWLLVYGDTNSTLAGALAAAKLHVPVCHVEAGLRSFDKRMPEEINRILTDHVSKLLLCPTQTAIVNLKNEGVLLGVHHVGDVMYDAALIFAEVAGSSSDVLERYGLKPKSFCLATVHRAENTDDLGRLTDILEALSSLASAARPLLLPLHPRTRATLKSHGLEQVLAKNPSLLVVEPVSFLDMIVLEQQAALILTDSGGVQKEAYFHGVPCVTLRDETEWVETIEAGWNQLAGADRARIEQAAAAAKPGRSIDEYGDGKAASKVVDRLVSEWTSLAN
ncbi:MAG TPA: UDP-N-acetylglucosamine 2-epimerase (non-hydrolyzing) [Polyangiaceae bacterium]|nr:UDP-N-acetylglucosamine 2-epimerase (non-hydrolyzing) [Polyangiaceae bacterium]